MRKFLLPIINLVNVILVSIAWGISGNTAIVDAARGDAKCGNLYQVVWMGTKANVIGIVGFFLFCVAVFLTLVAFLPLKGRKFVTCAGGLMYVGAGVLFLLAPKTYDYAIQQIKLTSTLIAMAVLILVAGALTLCMSVLEFASAGKENAKNGKEGFFSRLKREISEKKHGLFYVVGSCLTVIFSIVVIILVAKVFRPVLIFIYLGLVLAFFVTLFVFEVLANKEKKAKK